MNVIEVRDLSKRYRIGLQEKRHETLAGQIGSILRAPFDNFRKLRDMSRFGDDDESIFWALKDINFDVQQGDVLGIIGHNGAGKSTLLKILSRITEPTSGEIRIKGRISALLEVGTGFHPELTGRENIYMNGTILGMTRKEIDRKLDEIVDFSGVEKYIDTPVKFYSSGMKVRLGFAVAAHLEPEILIIDEVLAVGDAEFQRKCIGKVRDVSHKDGRTVIFVSHDMAAISKLCNNSIFLAKGAISYLGKTQDAIIKYLSTSSNHHHSYNGAIEATKPTFTKISIITSETNYIQKNGEPLIIDMGINMPNPIEGMAVSIQVINAIETSVIYAYVFDTDTPILRKKGINRIRCIIPKCRLYEGNYFLRAHLAESKGRTKFQELDRICHFEVKILGSIVEWGWQKDVMVYSEEFFWQSKL